MDAFVLGFHLSHTYIRVKPCHAMLGFNDNLSWFLWTLFCAGDLGHANTMIPEETENSPLEKSTEYQNIATFQYGIEGIYADCSRSTFERLCSRSEDRASSSALCIA